MTKAQFLLEIFEGDMTLRQFRTADARALFELIDGSREHLSQNGDDTAAKYPTFDSVHQSILFPKNPKRLRFGVWINGKLVGSVNLTPREGDPRAAEIGYWLGESHCGRGYATRAVKALAAYGCAFLDFKRIIARTGQRNHRSADVLRRAGFCVHIAGARREDVHWIWGEEEEPTPARDEDSDT